MAFYSLFHSINLIFNLHYVNKINLDTLSGSFHLDSLENVTQLI